MKQIEECVAKILASVSETNRIEEISLVDSLGRVASCDICSFINVPEFPKSAMDGYAVNSSDVADLFSEAERDVTLEVQGKLTAGDWEILPFLPKTAVRVMTGAYIPEGYDAVVRQEDTDYGTETVKIKKAPKAFENYCQIGEDIKKGDIILKKGEIIDSVRLGNSC